MHSERERAAECRQHAQACLELAERTSLGPERATLLEMAQHWLDLATRAETRKPQCPKCEIEMRLFCIEASQPEKKRTPISVYECTACGRMAAIT